MMKKVYVSIYNRQRKYLPKIEIANTCEQIASMIVLTKESPRIVITDAGNNMILDTIGGFIDTCYDMDYLEELLKVLIPMQEGEPVEEVKVIDWGVSEQSYNNSSYMIPFIKSHTGIDLEGKIIDMGGLAC